MRRRKARSKKYQAASCRFCGRSDPAPHIKPSSNKSTLDWMVLAILSENPFSTVADAERKARKLLAGGSYRHTKPGRPCVGPNGHHRSHPVAGGGNNPHPHRPDHAPQVTAQGDHGQTVGVQRNPHQGNTTCSQSDLPGSRRENSSYRCGKHGLSASNA